MGFPSNPIKPAKSRRYVVRYLQTRGTYAFEKDGRCTGPGLDVTYKRTIEQAIQFTKQLQALGHIVEWPL